jgi:hypothetical protein
MRKRIATIRVSRLPGIVIHLDAQAERSKPLNSNISAPAWYRTALLYRRPTNTRMMTITNTSPNPPVGA